MSTENPYTPPVARVDDIAVDDPDAPRKRPIPVWILCIWIWFGLVSTPWGFYWAFTSDMPEMAALRAFYVALSPVYWVLMAVGLVLSAVFSIQLFRLHRVAWPLAIAMLVLTGLNSFLVPSPDAVGASKWFGFAFAIVFYVAVVAYVWHLKRKGTLR